jgi:hypothetical protein
MVKKLLSAFYLFILSSTILSSQCGNLYIGGVFDGSLPGGTPKGIQICASGDISDLSIYGIGVANNGGGSDGQEYDLPALAISSGDCFWIANEGSNTGAFQSFFGFEPCYLDNIANINGDDAIELFCSGILEDEFGDVALDGTGECWEYLDGWGKNSLGGPNFGSFNCADWNFSGTNTNDNETSNALADVPYPAPDQVCPAVAPITLGSFDGILLNSNVSLTWTTLSETNNDYFEILRSADGSSFEVIGKVEGNGNSSKMIEYSFVDNRPSSGVNYYKLKQVDLDGRSESFDVVMIQNKSNDVRIYPTQVVNSINIELTNDKLSTLSILNSSGMIQTMIRLNSSFNSVDISDLPSGIYFVKVESENSITIEKIVKI